MTRTVLFGASGYTGGLVAEVLADRGQPFVAAGRDVARVRARVGHLDAVQDVVRADVEDASALRDLLAEADVVVTTVGPFTRLGRGVLEAAIATGTHYADSTGELPFVRWAFEQDGRAAAAGIAAVPAAGHDFVPGDLLAGLACGALDEPREVHVTYLVRARGPLPGFTTAGTRASVAEVVGEPALALVQASTREEGLAQERRLAWFPKPVGPYHAASFPGAEPLTVPRHVTGLRTVRTYLAMPSGVAELAQATATLAARSTRVRRGVSAVLRANRRDPTPAQREQVRWACVAEAVDDAGTVARAWANGRDIYAFTAHCLAEVAEALARSPSVQGVVAPSELLDATATLDALADRAGLRWSVKRPSA